MPQPFKCHLCNASFDKIPSLGFEGLARVQLMEHLHNVHGLEPDGVTYTPTQQISVSTKPTMTGQFTPALAAQNWRWN